MKKISNEVKTGIMVVACLLILLGLTAKVGGLSTLKKGYALKVQFNYASGLKKGAPVHLTGVKVGDVKDVQINYDGDGTKVVMTLWVDKGAKVRKDSKASIATMGLMGEKYLEFSSGSKGTPFLEEGSLIIGKEPIILDEVMDKAAAIADNLNAGIGDLRKLTQNVDSTIAGNRSQIDDIIRNMNETSRNFVEFSDEIRRNPWKLLVKKEIPKEKPKVEKKIKGNAGSFK